MVLHVTCLREMKNWVQNLAVETERKYHLEDLSVDRKFHVKMDLREVRFEGVK
jgi:hypothetical protein